MTESDKRTSAMILTDIQSLVASVDGISTTDAMRLGSLVQEYGSAKAGESIGPMFTALLDSAIKKPRNPWEAP
jgi:hypothetical protein